MKRKKGEILKCRFYAFAFFEGANIELIKKMDGVGNVCVHILHVVSLHDKPVETYFFALPLIIQMIPIPQAYPEVLF